MTTSKFNSQIKTLRPDFQPDPAQKQAIEKLALIYDQLTSKSTNRFLKFFRKAQSVQGLYLWGKVGRGKTYLMDLFYEALPFKEKQREHFHEFMRNIHLELKNQQGHSDPLRKVASDLASKTRVICFDEFIVTDIANAMLLGRLFTALFDAGLTLIATSNTELDNLYEGGLQRERFLPAIALLKQHMEETSVDNNKDYRLQEKARLGSYFSPLNETANQTLQALFLELSNRTQHKPSSLEFSGRSFETIAHDDGVVWFTFNELCDKPRNAADYFEIIRQFHTVFISDIPDLSTQSDNTVLRFINLIDVFYDEQVKLIVSAEKNIDELYSAGESSKEFQRTASRLHEMQTDGYREKTLAKKYAVRL
jgi:cell division protein ZapE